MPQSLSLLLVHIVFSTHDRKPTINETIKSHLHAYLATVCRSQGCEAYRVNGVADHVHLAIRLPRTKNVSEVVQHIKTTSSKWVKLQPRGDSAFAWQSGYAAITFGGGEMQAILEYIENQEFHHKKWSFQDEYRSLLEEFGIEYDERYMWD